MTGQKLRGQVGVATGGVRNIGLVMAIPNIPLQRATETQDNAESVAFLSPPTIAVAR